MISWHGFAKCKGGLNREKDILKTIIVSGFTLFETKLFLWFERANVTSKGTKAWCKLHSKINFKIMYYIVILAQNLYVFLAIADVLN